MAKVLPFSEGELRLLASLVSHGIDFMVVGLSAAALQGAPVVTEDIDLWFADLNDPKLTQALREVGAAYVPPSAINPPMLAGRNTEPFDVVLSMSGLAGFADEVKHARKIQIGGLRLKVLSLERILTSKTAANRPKDRLVLPVLRDVVRTLKSKRHKPKRRKDRSKPRKD